MVNEGQRQLAGRRTTRCWCGNSELEAYAPDYLRCPACETLLAEYVPDPEALVSTRDESGFYSRNYYEHYLVEKHGLPTLAERARTDLSERCLYWLRTLLKYKIPPGKLLELGSAHGGFVALLRWAGFDAKGLEVSPWLVNFAQRTFRVPMLLGPIEQQAIAESSLDGIMLMDLLEHLPAPAATLEHCASLLKPDGLLLLQTPCYPAGKRYRELEQAQAPFLKMMIAPDHLFLFSQSSLRSLLAEAGFGYVQFLPALFPYDMFVAAARTPLVEVPPQQLARRLEQTPKGRLVQALLDLDEKWWDLTRRYAEAEADRSARLEVIRQQGQRIAEVEEARREESKRTKDLEARLHQLEAERAAQRELLEQRNAQLAELQANKQRLEQEVEDLRERLKSAEAEHAAAVATIQRQQEQLAALEEARVRAQQEMGWWRSEYEFVHSATQRLRRSLVYRGLRKLRLWGWLAAAIERETLTMEKVGQGMPARQVLRRVLVDLTPVLPGGENGGAKVVTLELVKELSRLAPDCEFILLTSPRSHQELAFLDMRNVRRLCVGRSEVWWRGLVIGFLNRMAVTLRGRWNRLAASLDALAGMVAAGTSANIARGLGADLLFCPFTAPFFYEPGLPTVCVIYDLQYLDYPQFFDPEERALRDRAVTQACRVSSRVVCISEHVRERILSLGLAPPERVDVVQISLANRLRRPPEQVQREVLRRYRLQPDSYLLYPANFWPHKNHEMLLTAFGMYCAWHPESSLRLVLTGAPGERMKFIARAAASMGLQERVVFPGFLPEEEFAALLYGCRAVIFPSLYEGFGMPVLEAMAAGKPVLASKLTSLPEVLGEAGLQFDPRKPREIAEAIEKLEDSQWVTTAVHKGLLRAALFSDGHSMASRYWRIFQQAVAQRPLLQPGVYGVYPDGWSGRRFMVVYGEGPHGRKLVLRVRAPGWLPGPGMRIRASQEIASAVGGLTYHLSKGATVNLERSLPPTAGSWELLVEPVFQPKALGIGQDPRWLGCRVLAAEIRRADGRVELLEFFSYGL